MSAHHYHLLASHIPFLGVAFCLLLFVIGVILRSGRVQRISLFFILLTSLLTITVYISGRGAEKVLVEKGVISPDEIYDHILAAETSFVLLLVTGVFAFAGFIKRTRNRLLPNWFSLLLLLLLVIDLALAGGTVNIGLRISHPELGADQTEVIQDSIESTVPVPADSVIDVADDSAS